MSTPGNRDIEMDSKLKKCKNFFQKEKKQVQTQLENACKLIEQYKEGIESISKQNKSMQADFEKLQKHNRNLEKELKKRKLEDAPIDIQISNLVAIQQDLQDSFDILLYLKDTQSELKPLIHRISNSLQYFQTVQEMPQDLQEQTIHLARVHVKEFVLRLFEASTLTLNVNRMQNSIVQNNNEALKGNIEDLLSKMESMSTNEKDNNN